MIDHPVLVNSNIIGRYIDVRDAYAKAEKDAKAADGQGKRVKGLRIVLAAKSRKKAQEK
ncbi:MAG: hypothetical protein HOL92_05600 [Opitutales bacterium]|nr:hypothetical protein [Opitutales bacterium]